MENMTETERKKVLVIEDNADARRNFQSSEMERVDVPNSLIEAEEFLRTRPYVALLLDRDLSDSDYIRKSQYEDQDFGRKAGEQIAIDLRQEKFGGLNRELPILGISGGYERFPGVLENMGKPYAWDIENGSLINRVHKKIAQQK